MRIAVDARELEGHPTGVGRVLEGLLGSWPDDDEIVLFSRTPIHPRVHVRPTWTRDVAPGPAALPGSLWEQFILPGRVRRKGCELLLSPAYGMPLLAPCPAVVGMHDCAFAALPGTFRPRERFRRRIVARIAARRAAFLFAGSEFAADEAVRELGVRRERVQVLPYGVQDSFRPASDEAVAAARTRYALPQRPWLFVGSHLERRGLPGLADLVAELTATHPSADLCFLGVAPGNAPTGGRWLGYIEDRDLPALYTAAEAVLYPSLYEGFGLPVMEALACGTPVLTSDTASLAEIYPGRATLLSNDDLASWAAAIRQILTDPPAARKAVAGAAEWARARTWHDAARRLRDRAAGESR